MSHPATQIANQLLIYAADTARELMTNMKLQKCLGNRLPSVKVTVM
ncbi:MAG: hypothetical protein IKM95_07385 [Bacteroidales bacterium]|nr:hypothetical protein [Bacteroidales bacterium]